MVQTDFDTLKKHFGSHKRAAEHLGISYTRYNEWRWKPEGIPRYAMKLIELAVREISSPPLQ